MNTAGIRLDLDRFETAARTLGSEVAGASALWTDEKYDELAAALRVIADGSRNVIVAGERCCHSVENFIRISEAT